MRISQGFTEPVFRLCLLVSLFGYCSFIDAAITPTGDYSPDYNGTDDPWICDLIVGNNAEGALTIDAGSVVYNGWKTYIGNNTGSSGSATLSGVGSEWYCVPYVGYRGDGSLLIENGGYLYSNYNRAYIGNWAGSTGTVTVTGPGSTWAGPGGLHIGYVGTGALNIENGGSVSNSEECYLGRDSGAFGSAYVSGPGSVWSNLKDLHVGNLGDGSLLIENGGTVSNTQGYVGSGNGSTATVTGPGSAWNNESYLHVGNLGPATLLIEDGGTVTSNSGSINAHSIATVTGPGSTWISSNDITVGTSGTGTLRIEKGALVSSGSARIGNSSLSSGTVTVTGNDSVWNNTLDLYVAYDGEGTLNISDGGEVNVGLKTYVSVGPNRTISSGRINFNNGTLNTGSLIAAGSELLGNGVINTEGIISDVDLVFDSASGLSTQTKLNGLPGQNVVINVDQGKNPGTTILGVGYRGTGVLTIADGNAISSIAGYLGYHVGADGRATVTGSGSRWDISSDDFFVGSDGTGMLLVEDGGSASAVECNIGYSAGSNGSVTISGPGSNLTTSLQTVVGFYGKAAMTIENGGTVTTGRISRIGYGAGSEGAVTVTGEGSLWQTSHLFTVGDQGDGTLTIADGGEVRVTRDITLGQNEGSSGTINLAGGTLDLNRKEIVRGEGEAQFNFTGGTLKNATAVDMDVIQQGGALAPGGPIGRTNISGGYDIQAGTIEIDLGGAENPYDNVTALRDINIATTGTTLSITAHGPMAAGSYTILSSYRGSLTGMFENVTMLNMFGADAELVKTNFSLSLVLNHDLVFADANLDGYVGVEDLDIVLNNWNAYIWYGGIAAGDLDGDGFVGLDDLDAVLTHWNEGTPPTEVLASVPEPAVVMTMFAGIGAFLTRRT